MTLNVGKWGNSLAVRIPAQVAEQAGIREGTNLTVEVHNGSVVLALSKTKPTLRQLLDRVQPDNLHQEGDWGVDVGDEF